MQHIKVQPMDSVVLRLRNSMLTLRIGTIHQLIDQLWLLYVQLAVHFHRTQGTNHPDLNYSNTLCSRLLQLLQCFVVLPTLLLYLSLQLIQVLEPSLFARAHLQKQNTEYLSSLKFLLSLWLKVLFRKYYHQLNQKFDIIISFLNQELILEQ